MRHVTLGHRLWGLVLPALAVLFTQAPAPAQVKTWQQVEGVWNQVQFFRNSNKTFHKYRKMVTAKQQYATAKAKTLRVAGYPGLATKLERAYIDEAVSVARINVSEIRRVRNAWRNIGAFFSGRRRLTYNTARSFHCLKKDEFVQAATLERRQVEAEIDKQMRKVGIGELVDRATNEELAKVDMAYDWIKVLHHDRRWLREDTAQQLTEEVAADAPVAVIWADKTKGSVPLKVTFSAARSVGVGLDYFWDLGGKLGAGMDVQRTFDEPKQYAVKLSAVDDEERTGTAELTITAEAQPVTVELTGQRARPSPVAPGGSVLVQVVAQVKGLAKGVSAQVEAVLKISGQSKPITHSCENGDTGFTWLQTRIPENTKPGTYPFSIRAKLTNPDERIYSHSDNKLVATVPGSYVVAKAAQPQQPEDDPFVGRWDAVIDAKAMTEEGWKKTGLSSYLFTIERIDASTIKMTPDLLDEPVRVFRVDGNTAHYEGKWTDSEGRRIHEKWTMTAANGSLQASFSGTYTHKDARGNSRTDPFEHKLRNATRLR